MQVRLAPSELLGLTIDAIDPDAGTIRVERQVVELSGRPLQLGPVKSKASTRELPAPQAVVAVPLEHVATYGSGPEGATSPPTGAA